IKISLTPSIHLHFGLPFPLPLSTSNLSTLPTILSSFILHISPDHFSTHSSSLSITPFFHLYISLILSFLIVSIFSIYISLSTLSSQRHSNFFSPEHLSSMFHTHTIQKVNTFIQIFLSLFLSKFFLSSILLLGLPTLSFPLPLYSLFHFSSPPYLPPTFLDI